MNKRKSLDIIKYNKNILYIEESMINENKIKNNFDMNLFIEKIGNKKAIFDLIKYKITSELKYIISNKIKNLNNFYFFVIIKCT